MEKCEHSGSSIELAKSNSDDSYVQELQRLLMCYQVASRDDKNVVWAALNKYVAHINCL